MAVGDVITIEKGDGKKLNYRVTHTEEVPLDQVDMKKLLLPYGSATNGLNLITCSGSYVKASATYDHRTIVYAEQA
jgi:sortase (surface protein transpeptidase)